MYAKMSGGSFPKSISLGERAVGWIEAEVLDWLQEQIKKSRGGSEL
ncbi:helix-turn-helix transcriptional regulator [Geovibrio sp. ADMFC3]